MGSSPCGHREAPLWVSNSAPTATKKQASFHPVMQRRDNVQARLKVLTTKKKRG